MADASSSNETSQLLELLRRIRREETGTVGFGRRQPVTRRGPLTLIAALADTSEAPLAVAREAGADAALVALRAETAVPSRQRPGEPWPVGAIAEADAASERLVAPADLERWTGAGIDAVAIQPRHALAACFNSHHNRLFAVLEPALPPDGLRAYANLTVGAFVLNDPVDKGRLNGGDLLSLAIACAVLPGPILLLSQRVVPEDLEVLVGQGVAGLALRFPADAPADQIRSTLAALREAIDGLDPHLLQRRRERRSGPVVIPFSGLRDE